MPELHWQKSSFSSEASNCIELATTHDGVIYLRESDNSAVTLTIQARELASLLFSARRSGSPSSR